jgi:hypothetical protein
MVHYYFSGTGTDIVAEQPTKKERGSSPVKKDADGEEVNTKLSFDKLPGDVQSFIRNYWDDILG